MQSMHLKHSNLAFALPYHFGSVNAKHALFFGFGAVIMDFGEA